MNNGLAAYLATASLYTNPARARLTISRQRSEPSILQCTWINSNLNCSYKQNQQTTPPKKLLFVIFCNIKISVLLKY